MPRTISPEVARRYLVLRHLLAPPRSLPAEPASVMRTFDRLGSVQFDPLDIAGRNHDLVLHARVNGYRRQWTDDLLYRERKLYETYNKGLSLVPTSELPWYRVSWDLNRERFEKTTFLEHEALVKELLERIQNAGPLTSGDMPARAAIDWFWRPTNQVRAMLEALAIAGILGIARRDGNRRVYDLVERLFPAELLAERHPVDAQRRHKLLSRYRAHGLLGPAGSGEGWREVRHIPAEDEHFLDQAERELAAGAPPGGTQPQVSFIAPLDPLVWDRRLLRDLFGFDYLWEVYVPEARRRWGYYVLPILYGDRFVGRIEPRVDRKAGVLRVLGLWWEKGFSARRDADLRRALEAALEAHRQFAGVKKIVRRPKSSAT